MSDRPVFLYVAIYDDIASRRGLRREIDAAAREGAGLGPCAIGAWARDICWSDERVDIGGARTRL